LHLWVSVSTEHERTETPFNRGGEVSMTIDENVIAKKIGDHFRCDTEVTVDWHFNEVVVHVGMSVLPDTYTIALMIETVKEARATGRDVEEDIARTFIISLSPNVTRAWFFNAAANPCMN
jgi:hypothetical protein